MNNQSKKNKIKLILTLVVAVIFFISVKLGIPSDNQAVENFQKTISRIDVSTTLADNKIPQIKIYVGDSTEAEGIAQWMLKRNMDGVSIESEENTVNFNIVALKDNKITINLISQDLRDENNKHIDIWLDYTSFLLNGNELLDSTISTCARKGFRYSFDAKAGKTYNVIAKWQKHKEMTE